MSPTVQGAQLSGAQFASKPPPTDWEDNVTKSDSGQESSGDIVYRNVAFLLRYVNFSSAGVTVATWTHVDQFINIYILEV